MLKTQTSIRRQLLVFLIGSLVVWVVAAAVFTYLFAVRSANGAYDRSLLDPAMDIAGNLSVASGRTHVELPQKALDALTFDQSDTVVYQVRAADGTVVAGTAWLPPAPVLANGAHIFFDGLNGAEPIRIAGLRTSDGSYVQVAETLHKRNRLVREILGAELLATLGMALIAIGLAWAGVTHGLRTLEHLRAEMLRRSASDLRPLPETDLPSEIEPLVRAFNFLIDQLREASSVQRRFLANAAHQLRTPLAGLQMHFELLLRGPLPPETRAEVEHLHGGTVRAARLANQLLALAKADRLRDQDARVELVDLRTVVDTAARNWAHRANTLRIDLGFALQSAPLVADPELLPDLVDNLIDNALRYTPSGGTVTVRTGCIDGAPFLIVEDSGPGIPKAERNKVLERFYRIRGTVGEGSGLGLAIVSEIVGWHEGSMEIGPDDNEAGTRIRVMFPPPDGLDRGQFATNVAAAK